MHPLALARGRAGDHAGNPRGLGRDEGHDGRRDEGIGAARRVGAHGTHGDPPLPEHHAGHGLPLEVRDALPLKRGEVAHLFLGEADVLLERVVGGGLGVIHLLSRYPERGRTPVVEALRVPAHRCLALVFHRAENLADRGADLVRNRLRLGLGGFQAFRHDAPYLVLRFGRPSARGRERPGLSPLPCVAAHAALATRTRGSWLPGRGRSCPRSPCTGRWPAA